MTKRRKKKMDPLRLSLARWETDTLIPLWLVFAILAAAGSEIWTIGSGVYETYKIQVGWAVGLTIASTQAMASMLTARALAHNATVRTRTKVAAWPNSVKVAAKVVRFRLPQRRVIDVERSESRLDVRVPLAISAGAGLASALSSWALYAEIAPDRATLNAILAAVAPAGSLAAALLNGMFAYGEQEIAARRALPERPRKVAIKPTASRPKPPSKPKRSPETDPGLARHLATLAAVVAGNGQPSEPFRRSEVETILGRSHTIAKKVIRYGLDTGELEKQTGEDFVYKFVKTRK